MEKICLGGRTVAITGASGGIGAAAAEAFGAKKARLILSGRKLSLLEEAAERARKAGGEAHTFVADVTDPDQMCALVDRAFDLTGSLDVMFLGAGYGLLDHVENVTLERWRDQMEVNFFGVLNGFYAALPHFLKRGRGQYVIMNSLSGRMGMPFSAPYSASKFALWGFADCARSELAAKNIGLLSVYPYFVKTRFQSRIKSEDFSIPPELASKMWGQSPEKLAKKIVKGVEKRKGEILCTPLGRIGTRVVPLSFTLSEAFRRRLVPVTKKILRQR